MNRAARLLVVDDNPVVLLGLSESLRQAGLTVHEARSAAEALHLAREFQPDLALLDVRLPDINGVELCRRLKADPALKTLFVVLLSSSEISPHSQMTGLDAGADGYIARPIDSQELLARVQSLLRIQQADADLRRAHDELELRVADRTRELAAANAALRAMSLRLVEIQEHERRALARELHDEVGQVLTGLKMLVDQTMPLTAEPVRERLSEAGKLVNHLLDQMRRLSLELRPQLLDDLGLLVALEWHFQRYTKQTGIRVDFQHSPLAERLPSVLETAVFRLVQEALTNAARHARVTSVTVRLWANASHVGLQVEDQGAGFDVEAGTPGSSGLAGMRERTALLGGEFTLESNPGRGTRLTVEFPCNVDANGEKAQPKANS